MEPVAAGAAIADVEAAKELRVMICGSDSISAPPVDLFGGKAAGLYRLSHVCGASIPAWFALPVSLFLDHLKASGAEPFVQRGDFDAAKAAIIAHAPSDVLRAAIGEGLRRIGDEGLFAVRSSGAMEDSSKSSCAGLFDTVLKVDAEGVCDAVLKVWLSLYAEGVCLERERLGICHAGQVIAVIVQKMVDASSAGVASSEVLSTGFRGVEISATRGLGDRLVEGAVSADSWVVDSSSGVILESHRGTTEPLCLNLEQVRAVFQLVCGAQDYVGYSVDVEYAFDQAGKLWALQERPLVHVADKEITVVDPKEAEGFKVLATGAYSLPGVALGRLIFIPDWDSLASGAIKVGEGDIAACMITTNVWSQHLANVSGLITRDGSASSHPMLLCREKGRPCLVSLKGEDFEAVRKAADTIVTLDGYNQRLYLGAVPTKAATREDLMARFAPMQMRTWPTFDDSIEALTHNHMVMNVEGKFWRKTPTFSIKRLQAEINLMRFEVLDEVIGIPGYKALGIYSGGFVGCEMSSYKDFILSFEETTLEGAEAFNARGLSYIRDFITLSNDLSPENIGAWAQVYARMRAFVWMSGALRYYSEREIDRIGVSLGLPRYYLEIASEQIQSEIHELDTEMQLRVHALAQEMAGTLSPEQELTKEILDHSLHPAVAELSQLYRFEHQIALDRPHDVSFAYRRLLQEVEHIRAGGAFVSQKRASHKTVLPEHPEFEGWLRVYLHNRALQSDAHHIEARGKCLARPRLIEHWGEGVFDMSLEEIVGKK